MSQSKLFTRSNKSKAVLMAQVDASIVVSIESNTKYFEDGTSMMNSGSQQKTFYSDYLAEGVIMDSSCKVKLIELLDLVLQLSVLKLFISKAKHFFSSYKM